MRKEYHCLIAGLPELLFDASKLSFALLEFKSYLKEELSKEDFNIIASHFWKYDNQNLLLLLEKKKGELNPAGNLGKEDFEVIFSLVRDDALSGFEKQIPSYFEQFIYAYRNESPLNSIKSWENQITDLYYAYVTDLQNDFVKEWYKFEMDLNNILTASHCKRFQIDIEPELIGRSELTDKLVKSSARDFGIGNEFPKIEQILRAIDETDLLEKEKRIDLIKWEFLDERSFFYYFTVERIFSYLLKLEMTSRWIGLDKKTGEELFNRLLKDLEASHELPEVFS
ncbi:MAG: DUF2764 family protein [Bacteroidales bacterium]|nr:DUF2764 family protein [Bacteroidales bacterium]